MSDKTEALKCETCGRLSHVAVEAMPLTSARYRLLTLPPQEFCYGHDERRCAVCGGFRHVGTHVRCQSNE